MSFHENSQNTFVDHYENFSNKNQSIRFEKNKSESALDKYTSVADLSTYNDSFKNKSLHPSAEENGFVGNSFNDNTRSFRNYPTGIPKKGNTNKKSTSSYEPVNSFKGLNSYDADKVSPKTSRPEDTYFKGSFETYTTAGGGATFIHEYNDAGDVFTKNVKLAKFKNRSDKQNFKSKSENFLDTVGRSVEMIKPEDNEAAASNLDEKAILATVIAKGLLDDEIKRYGNIQKSTNKEIKRLKKEIREQPSKEETPFLGSQAVFQDDTESFTDRYMGIFRENGRDYRGNDYFDIISTENAGVGSKNVAAIRKTIETKMDYKADKAFDSSVSSKFSNESSFEKKDSINSGVQSEGVSKNSQSTVVDSKFSKTTISDENNKRSKSVDSYFDNDKKTNHNNSKKEELELKNSEKKTTKKAKDKAKKKAAAVASVSNMLRTKKELQNDLGNMSGEVSGNLLKDGSAGMLKAAIDGIKSLMMNKVRELMIKAVSAFFSGLLSFFGSFLPFFLPIILVVGLITSFVGVFLDTETFQDGDGYTYYSLSEEEIAEIIEEVRLEFPYDFNLTQEAILNYSLSKVGCEYNQAYHARTDVDIFDCSSLAYRTYKDVGIDISNNGIFTASEECRMAIDSGFVASELIPGDLIFYGGSSNGRYLGVYHVAIYVGNGKMVEAKGRTWGVVYGDLRTNNIVSIGRYAA